MTIRQNVTGISTLGILLPAFENMGASINFLAACDVGVWTAMAHAKDHRAALSAINGLHCGIFDLFLESRDFCYTNTYS